MSNVEKVLEIFCSPPTDEELAKVQKSYEDEGREFTPEMRATELWNAQRAGVMMKAVAEFVAPLLYKCKPDEYKALLVKTVQFISVIYGAVLADHEEKKNLQ